MEVILSESRQILRFRPGLIIAEHRLGVVIANAGVDHSNVPGAEEGERVLLLPQDPDASSRVRATPCRSASEWAGGGGERQRRARLAERHRRARAWRRWAARRCSICAAGPTSKGVHQVTQVGLADEIASAAQLLMGEADEGRPAVLVRGLAWDGPPLPASALLRDPELDLFR